MSKSDRQAAIARAGEALLPWLDVTAQAAGIAIEAGPANGQLVATAGFPVGRCGPELAAALSSAANDRADATWTVELASHIKPHAAQPTLAPLPRIRNIIAVASAKGGVGKSTTTANLAAALSLEGAAVGILDADIYGPSQPTMLGLAGASPVSHDGKTFEPLEAHGIRFISIGCLVDQDRPIIWRGPMVTQALNQLLFQTNWGDLDYLIVDMPPGTGDTQLTLTQKVPLAGAVIVTTPQDIALLDARRGLKMFEKVGIPVLGIVENMSTHVCPECGHESALFGAGGGERLAAEAGVPLLGCLPLDLRIRQEADGGLPTVLADPDCDIAVRYRQAALRAAARIALHRPDHSGSLPGVVVE